MQLELESGSQIIRDPTEKDICAYVGIEGFAILSVSEYTYIQCAEHDERTGEFQLEYQDGSVDEHYRAADEPITLDRILTAFVKYLRKDESWRSDFDWEKMKLP
jgi:hypothetical protein